VQFEQKIPKFIPYRKNVKFFMPHFPIFTGNIKSFNSFKVKYVLEKFGSPERKLKNVIHVVGTNGKGSTCAYLKAILLQSGFKVNTYTSPHLHASNERINVNGEEISDEKLFYFTEKIRLLCFAEDLQLTLFESLTITTILCFSEAGGDFNIFEAGMGGQNDATNIFEAEQFACGIMTSISLDHTRFLGETEMEIATAKLGIMKEGKPFVMHPFTKEVLDSVKIKLSKTAGIPFFYGRDYNFSKVEFEDGIFGFEFQFQQEEPIILPMPHLLGEHQLFNLAGVLTALKAMNLEISEGNLIAGIMNTKWAGRLEKVENNVFAKIISGEDEIWFDGAHNPGGANALAKWISENDDFEYVLIVSKTKDSEVFKFLQAFQGKILFGIAVVGKGEIYPEKTSVIMENFTKLGIENFEAEDLLEAIKFAKLKGLSCGKLRIIICGSLYLAREINKFY
jgi:dihydrofolate synthase/folylpolyglutamate synthase